MTTSIKLDAPADPSNPIKMSKPPSIVTEKTKLLRRQSQNRHVTRMVFARTKAAALVPTDPLKTFHFPKSVAETKNKIGNADELKMASEKSQDITNCKVELNAMDPIKKSLPPKFSTLKNGTIHTNLKKGLIDKTASVTPQYHASKIPKLIYKNNNPVLQKETQNTSKERKKMYGTCKNTMISIAKQNFISESDSELNGVSVTGKIRDRISGNNFDVKRKHKSSTEIINPSENPPSSHFNSSKIPKRFHLTGQKHYFYDDKAGDINKERKNTKLSILTNTKGKCMPRVLTKYINEDSYPKNAERTKDFKESDVINKNFTENVPASTNASKDKEEQAEFDHSLKIDNDNLGFKSEPKDESKAVNFNALNYNTPQNISRSSDGKRNIHIPIPTGDISNFQNNYRPDDVIFVENYYSADESDFPHEYKFRQPFKSNEIYLKTGDIKNKQLNLISEAYASERSLEIDQPPAVDTGFAIKGDNKNTLEMFKTNYDKYVKKDTSADVKGDCLRGTTDGGKEHSSSMAPICGSPIYSIITDQPDAYTDIIRSRNCFIWDNTSEVFDEDCENIRSRRKLRRNTILKKPILNLDYDST